MDKYFQGSFWVRLLMRYFSHLSNFNEIWLTREVLANNQWQNDKTLLMIYLDVSVKTHKNYDTRNFILKWYYAQFSVQMLGFNCYIFQRIAINNDE